MEAQKVAVNKTYEGFLTNGTVVTHLWCPFRVKRHFHFLRLFYILSAYVVHPLPQAPPLSSSGKPIMPVSDQLSCCVFFINFETVMRSPALPLPPPTHTYRLPNVQ